MHSVINHRFICSWLLTCLCTCVFIFAPIHKATATTEQAAWEAFASGKAIAIMRHAIAPGNGDPVEFELGDCRTQRNLSKEGQLQAQQIGLQIKEHGIEQAEIYTSQWCRCFDTATNLELGSAQDLPMLNSFYQDRSTESAQTEQLTQWMVNRLTNSEDTNTTVDQQENAPAILVTHQVNITALTGVFPSSGEVVFVTLENDQLTALTTWNAEF